MDYGTTSVHKFRTKKGFKQNDVISTKEQSVLIKKNEFIWRRKHANAI